jgi:hypothetical protein
MFWLLHMRPMPLSHRLGKEKEKGKRKKDLTKGTAKGHHFPGGV